MDLLRSVRRRRRLRFLGSRFDGFNRWRGRSGFHYSLHRRRRCRAESLLGLGVQRLARICLQSLLLLREGHRRGRRSHSGHYCPGYDRSRRLRRSARRCGVRGTFFIRAHDARFDGRHRRCVNRGSCGDRTRSNFHRCLGHWLGIHERCTGHCGYRTSNSLVYIVRCLNVVVHHVRYGGLLHHGVGDVYVSDVSWAGLARGHVDFARSQRKPRHAATPSKIA